MTRHEIREAAFILMYQMLLTGGDVNELAETTTEAFEMPVNKSVLKLVENVTSHTAELDEIVGKYSTTRSVERIARINLVILRIALYELKYAEDVPAKVAINEAIELAKAYTEKTDSAFINGILNSYYKNEGGKS